MIEIINPYIVKILITSRDGDSVRAISKKISLSYAWTYNWVKKLAELSVIKRKGQKIKIDKDNAVYKEFSSFIKAILKERLSLTDAYSLPNLAGFEYAFTETDAVFVWTKGGYNIGRSKDNYPIFIEVLENELGKWRGFFDDFSVTYTTKVERKKGIYFILIPKKDIKKEFVSGVFATPLTATVEYAKKYIYNFEPALEMLDQMYKLNIGIKYAEKQMV